MFLFYIYLFVLYLLQNINRIECKSVADIQDDFIKKCHDLCIDFTLRNDLRPDCQRGCLYFNMGFLISATIKHNIESLGTIKESCFNDCGIAYLYRENRDACRTGCDKMLEIQKEAPNINGWIIYMGGAEKGPLLIQPDIDTSHWKKLNSIITVSEDDFSKIPDQQDGKNSRQNFQESEYDIDIINTNCNNNADNDGGDDDDDEADDASAAAAAAYTINYIRNGFRKSILKHLSDTGNVVHVVLVLLLSIMGMFIILHFIAHYMKLQLLSNKSDTLEQEIVIDNDHHHHHHHRLVKNNTNEYLVSEESYFYPLPSVPPPKYDESMEQLLDNDFNSSVIINCSQNYENLEQIQSVGRTTQDIDILDEDGDDGGDGDDNNTQITSGTFIV